MLPTRNTVELLLSGGTESTGSDVDLWTPDGLSSPARSAVYRSAAERHLDALEEHGEAEDRRKAAKERKGLRVVRAAFVGLQEEFDQSHIEQRASPHTDSDGEVTASHGIGGQLRSHVADRTHRNDYGQPSGDSRILCVYPEWW